MFQHGRRHRQDGAGRAWGYWGLMADIEYPESSPLDSWLKEAWSREPSVRAVDVDGATVRYRAWNVGQGAEMGLMFVHGFLAHARWWDHIAPHFANRYAVIAPDSTGSGDSDWRATYSRRQFAEELVAVARHADVGKLTIVAHSFGATAALYAAANFPDLIERVIVVDARVFLSGNEIAMSEPLSRRYPDAARMRTHYRLIPPGKWPVPAVEDYIALHSMRQTPEGDWTWKFDAKLFQMVGKDKLAAEVAGISRPVDFIRAECSEVVGEAEAKRFVDNFPGCGEPVLVPLSHHHIMIEQPVALVAALKGLLARPR